MDKKLVYKTKFSFLVYLVILLFFFPFSLYYDFKDNRGYFTELIYYLIPFFIMAAYFIMSLALYTKIIVYNIGFELSSHFFRKKIYYEWSKIDQIEFIFSRFTEIAVYFQYEGEIKKSQFVITNITKRKVVEILKILYINGINVKASGLIDKDWKNAALKNKILYENRL